MSESKGTASRLFVKVQTLTLIVTTILAVSSHFREAKDDKARLANKRIEDVAEKLSKEQRRSLEAMSKDIRLNRELILRSLLARREVPSSHTDSSTRSRKPVKLTPIRKIKTFRQLKTEQRQAR